MARTGVLWLLGILGALNPKRLTPKRCPSERGQGTN